MLALLLCQLMTTPAQVGAQVPGKGEGAEAIAPRPPSPKAPPSKDEGSPWTALRRALSSRLAADRKRLMQELATKFLPDLGLDYQENRQYLDRHISKLASLDPDMGGLLLPLLSPRSSGATWHRTAENVVRALELMDLTPYLGRLRELLNKGPLEARIRALHLLAGATAGKGDLVPVLERFLTDTPDAHLPRVLRCVGRYRSPVLADKVLPFLERPGIDLKLAALDALRQLGLPSTIGPAMQAVSSLSEPEALTSLLDLLGSVAAKLSGGAPEPAFLVALTHVLTRAEELSAGQALVAVRLVRVMGEGTLRSTPEALAKALDSLVSHSFTEVQFAAARALDHLGSDSGIKRILGRLSVFVDKNRKVPYAYSQRAKAYAAFGRFKEAVRDLEKAVKLSGKGRVDPTLYLKLAALEVELGNVSKVVRWLKEADPTGVELSEFRRKNPKIEPLLKRSGSLRKLFK